MSKKQVAVVVSRGRIEIDNNAAERALRCVALGRKNFLFAGFQRCGFGSKNKWAPYCTENKETPFGALLVAEALINAFRHRHSAGDGVDDDARA